jgi:hypothetical protein
MGNDGAIRARVSWFAYFSALIALCSVAGCSVYGFTEGVKPEPLEHRLLVNASGYSLDGCQANMDALAGSQVLMVEHTRQIAVTILNGFSVPTYNCRGVVQESQVAVGAPRSSSSQAK